MNQTVPDIRDRVGEPYAATADGQDRCSTSSTTSTQAFLDILRAAKPTCSPDTCSRTTPTLRPRELASFWRESTHHLFDPLAKTSAASGPGKEALEPATILSASAGF